MAKEKQRYSLKAKIWATVRILLLGALFYLGIGLIFFGSGFGNSYIVQQNAEKAGSNLTAKKVDRNKKRKTNYDASKTSSISAANALRAKKAKAYAIGRIAIPAVNIHNPLFAGYGEQNQNLAYGVVTCLPERVMGGTNNYVLAGHYMGSHGPAVLDNLHLVHQDDLIYVTDMHYIYAYKIKSISFAVKPSQVEVENNVQDRSMITLITCSDFNTSKYGYGQHRTVVQGDLINKIKATKHNLAATELSDKYSTASHSSKNGSKADKQVHPQAQPKFYQNMALIKAAITGFNIIFILFLAWRIIRVW